MPRCEPVDASFFDTAPQRFARTWQIARPAAEVWGELTSDTPLAFVRRLKVNWTSPRPFGVGTTRQVKALGGVLTAQELFFIWEEGHRYAFHFSEANLPFFTSLAEDYVVDADGPDACRFTWRVGIAPSALGQPGRPVNALSFADYFRDVGRYFDARSAASR